jgi:RNA polymerase sigma-70 factor (ECF subfamily)
VCPEAAWQWFRVGQDRVRMTANTPESQVVERVRSGDAGALATFFAEQRERLRRLIAFRMDPRLRGRVDAEDVLQEAYLDAAKRIRHFNGDSIASLFIWLRLVAQQTLIDTHRRHLGAQVRDVNREVSLRARGGSDATSVSMAANLIAQLTTPTQAARKIELAERLAGVLNQMDAIDREVLALRHFEELSNQEVAEELDIQPKAASIRYVRALRRLRSILGDFPEFRDVL